MAPAGPAHIQRSLASPALTRPSGCERAATDTCPTCLEGQQARTGRLPRRHLPAVTAPPRLCSVLADVDLSLAAWLSAALPPRTEIDFGPPARRADERPGRHPTVSVFLHAVDEDTAGLPAGEIRLRDETGRTAGIVLPTRRYTVSYLVTAWAGDPLTEHRLLGAVLVAHAGQDELGREHLRGVLADADVCVPLHIGQSGRPVAWDRLGLPGRSALTLTVLAPAVPPLVRSPAPPAEQLELVARSRPHPPGQDVAPPEDAGLARRWRRSTRTEP